MATWKMPRRKAKWLTPEFLERLVNTWEGIFAEAGYNPADSRVRSFGEILKASGDDAYVRVAAAIYQRAQERAGWKLNDAMLMSVRNLLQEFKDADIDWKIEQLNLVALYVKNPPKLSSKKER